MHRGPVKPAKQCCLVLFQSRVGVGGATSKFSVQVQPKTRLQVKDLDLKTTSLLMRGQLSSLTAFAICAMEGSTLFWTGTL
mmetsp:Transcript_16759/g.32429  ORF Transcript_16759/g.32429 Transcript_16759/m.32429 type:complete len:81 (+) Transcript_16759:195-437(+)